MNEEDRLKGFAALREPFEASQINKLPKPHKADSPKGKCPECGGYHGLPAVHLDYVGHAALTDRLLKVDPEWTWEPLAFGPDGLPQLDRNGGLWIRLTILGVTRLGYGDAQGKSGGNAIKEAIGDALRNGGMRFGAALDLWHKGDMYDAEEQQGKATPPPPNIVTPPKDWRTRIAAIASESGLQLFYEEAQHENWWTTEMGGVLSARKKELEAAFDPAAPENTGIF